MWGYYTIFIFGAVGVILLKIGLGVWLKGKENSFLFHDLENTYLDPQRNTRIQFPFINQPAEIELSVIIPAFNEEERLESTLIDIIDFLKQLQKNDSQFRWEIIVVDDGSADSTSKLALKYSEKETTEYVRVLTLRKNRGKGGAVRRGMLSARGKYMLMADADGATKFSDYLRLHQAVKRIEKNGLGLGIGSRAHLQSEAIAKRTFFRNLLMHGFHLMVNVLGVRGIKDTQCGFKLFTRRTAELIFLNIHIERWAFDVEMIYLGQYFGAPMEEVAVNWREIPGSKLSPVGASLQMGKDLFKLRMAYMFGYWTIVHR
jgi:dolichyl-phosphate beta-glucosyltransferase